MWLDFLYRIIPDQGKVRDSTFDVSFIVSAGDCPPLGIVNVGVLVFACNELKEG